MVKVFARVALLLLLIAAARVDASCNSRKCLERAPARRLLGTKKCDTIGCDFLGTKSVTVGLPIVHGLLPHVTKEVTVEAAAAPGVTKTITIVHPAVGVSAGEEAAVDEPAGRRKLLGAQATKGCNTVGCDLLGVKAAVLGLHAPDAVVPPVQVVKTVTVAAPAVGVSVAHPVPVGSLQLEIGRVGEGAYAADAADGRRKLQGAEAAKSTAATTSTTATKATESAQVAENADGPIGSAIGAGVGSYLQGGNANKAMWDGMKAGAGAYVAQSVGDALTPKQQPQVTVYPQPPQYMPYGPQPGYYPGGQTVVVQEAGQQGASRAWSAAGGVAATALTGSGTGATVGAGLGALLPI